MRGGVKRLEKVEGGIRRLRVLWVLYCNRQGRGWAIVEQNAVWGAGLYGGDPVRVLEILPYAMRSSR